MPHPILKRAHSAHVPAPVGPAPYHPSVHFPPSPSLTRTFSAHSPAYYDRSPIEVAPNTCALPARGCPGRTYYEGGKSRSHSSSNLHVPGKALHPRALAAYEAQLNEEDEDDDDDLDPQRTPTRTSPYIPLPVPPPIPGPYPNTHSHSHSSPYALPASASHYPTYLPQSAPAYLSNAMPPPPLIPDLSSSSDESDGFVSPPPEPVMTFHAGGPGKYPYRYPSAPPASYPYPYPYPYSSPQPPASAPGTGTTPSPPERKRRSRKSPPRHRGPSDGYEEEDLPGSYSHASAFVARAPAAASPERERPPKKSPSKDREGRSRKDKDGKKDRCVASLCRSLAGATFRDADSEGCLGGF